MQLRARGVPATAVQRDGDVVARRRQRALAQPDLADVEAGVTVHGEHGIHPVERPRRERLVRAAGDDLLGHLEDAAHGQAALDQRGLARLEGEQRAEQADDMHVVTAGVADARSARGPLEAGALAHGQGVHVSAQRHPVLRVRRTDVGQQAGAGQQAHPDARGIEAAGHGLGRARLLVRQLGMGMKIPPDVDELGCE